MYKTIRTFSIFSVVINLIDCLRINSQVSDFFQIISVFFHFISESGSFRASVSPAFEISVDFVALRPKKAKKMFWVSPETQRTILPLSL